VSIKIYDLAASNSEVRFSPFCWRVKLALAFKGLKFESIPIRFVEKDRIAFSGQKLLPVLVDKEKVIVDSWDIACYLDKFYPTKSNLLLGNKSKFLNNQYEYNSVPIWPSTSMKNIQIWVRYFARWDPLMHPNKECNLSSEWLDYW